MSFYSGNGAYCYSNSLAMFLSVIGENIPPSLIEVVTGFSLGASLERNNMLFFDNGLSSPDKGVNLAIKNLGFTAVEEVKDGNHNMPLEQLRHDLEEAPVLLGPVDMGYLSYLPNHSFLGGCDHYVLALEMNEYEILLHDPAGYPYVWLSLEQLEKAWKAESITWSEGAYRYWKSPMRLEKPSEDELYRKSLLVYKEIYKEQLDYSGFGSVAITLKATQLKNREMTIDEMAHLSHFAFPLGARRALDFSNFFKGRNDALSIIKKEQAQLFGKCYSYSSSQRWHRVAETLELLASNESQFKETLLFNCQ